MDRTKLPPRERKAQKLEIKVSGYVWGDQIFLHGRQAAL